MPCMKIVVNLDADRSYDVRIGAGQLHDVGSRIAGFLSATSVVVASDANVAPLYGQTVRDSFRQAGFRTMSVTVPAGEASKSLPCATQIWEALAAKGVDRDALVVALGGGVVGDLAGFCAATYLRGIRLVQMPTTLLAMVDSSVGGKSGVDLDQGKNLVGAFKQPLYVCADTDTLSTLPDREWACGCAEIAKSAIIDSDDFFFWLDENAEALVSRDAEVVQQAIARCVVFKADVVAADEDERVGVRDCLNYGHTLGHAIEKLAGYGTYSHGQAVAEGMRFAIRLSAALEGASMDLVSSQDDLLNRLGLPALDFNAPAADIISAMHADKKARGGNIRFVLPTDVGEWSAREVDNETLLAHLQGWERSKQQ